MARCALASTFPHPCFKHIVLPISPSFEGHIPRPEFGKPSLLATEAAASENQSRSLSHSSPLPTQEGGPGPEGRL